jgi:hypothetical protein
MKGMLDVTHVGTFQLHVIKNNITNMPTSEVGKNFRVFQPWLTNKYHRRTGSSYNASDFYYGGDSFEFRSG